MSNKRNKQRIRNVLSNGEELTTSEILFKMNNSLSTAGTYTTSSGKQKKQYQSRRHDTVTMNQLGNLMRLVATKKGFCLDSRQVIWKIKEVKNNVVDRKIQTE